MKSSSRYVLAFSLALLPALAWLGLDSARRVVVESCPICESTSQHEEHDWCFWGLRGSNDSRPVVEASRLFSDFPDFCPHHQWSHVSAKLTRRHDSPLFEARLRERFIAIDFMPLSCGGSLFVSEIRSYNEDPELRDLLHEALDDELVTRDQLFRWLELGEDDPAESGALEDEDVTAFDMLDAMFAKFLSGHRAGCSHCPAYREPRLPPPPPYEFPRPRL
ncbi:hypothetical protein [Haloferula sp. BvORR071]|uniref:hypothetical protein n=1 Tax=Haloferula sp. BvORR071 TaxID=1396141 RepID=UPI00054FE1F0|nr:hypothetical protein [Haloferula sp. BvORR071]